MALEETGVSLVVENEDAFQSALNSAGDAVGALGDIVGNVSGGIADAFDEIVIGALRRVGEVAIDALGQAAQAVIDFGVASFDGALEAEEGLARLSGAIRRAGEDSPITEERALELADAYKELAGGSDDAVIAAQAVLLKFQSINEDAFEPALATTLDLAAIMGVDVAAAAEQLGRALEDPERATRLLKAAGVVLTDQEKEQIKAWTESGDAASAQAFILDKLSKASAGAAADLANTTGGQLAIFQETIADAGETIATAFLPALMNLFDKVIKPNLPTIESLADSIANIISLLISGDFQGGIFGLMEDDDFISTLFDVRDVFKGLFDLFSTGNFESLDNVVSIVSGLIAQFVGGDAKQIESTLFDILAAFQNLFSAFQEHVPAMIAIGEDFAAWFSEALGIAFPQIIDNVISIINTLAEIWSEHGDTIMTVISVTFKFITATILGALTLVSGIIDAQLKLFQGVFDTWSAIFRGDWEGAWESASGTVSTVLGIIGDTLASFFDIALSIVGTNFEEFIKQWQDNFDMAATIVGHFIIEAIRTIENMYMDFYNAAGDLVEGVARGITDGIDWVKDAARDLAQAAVDEMQRILGIHSPSAVAMNLVGLPISEGIAEGIAAGAGAISSAFSGVIAPVMNPSQIGLGGAISNYSNSTSWNLNVNSAQSSQGIMSDFGIMQAMAS
jgi:phage-related protein